MRHIILPAENGVLLRDFVVADSELACAFEFDPDVKKYLWLPKKTKDDWVGAFKFAVQTRTYSAIAVVALPEHILAGRASIDALLNNQSSRELDIIIAKPFWGRGLGRIVADMLIRRAFEQLSANVVTATVHPENQHSLELLHAYGFVKVGAKPQGDGPQGGHVLYERRVGA
jgi:RimJ/RimL family protein N-acetyltransferase